MACTEGKQIPHTPEFLQEIASKPTLRGQVTRKPSIRVSARQADDN